MIENYIAREESFICYWDKIKNEIKTESSAFSSTLASAIDFNQVAILLNNTWDLWSNHRLGHY